VQATATRTNRQQQHNSGFAVQPLNQHATWKNRIPLYQFHSAQSNTQSFCGSTTQKTSKQCFITKNATPTTNNSLNYFYWNSIYKIPDITFNINP